jgi:hypothetical protein
VDLLCVHLCFSFLIPSFQDRFLGKWLLEQCAFLKHPPRGSFILFRFARLPPLAAAVAAAAFVVVVLLLHRCYAIGIDADCIGNNHKKVSEVALQFFCGCRARRVTRLKRIDLPSFPKQAPAEATITTTNKSNKCTIHDIGILYWYHFHVVGTSCRPLSHIRGNLCLVF